MRQPPPVTVRTHSGVGWRAVQAGLHAMAGAALVAWALLHADVAGLAPAVIGAATLGAAVAAAAWGWRRSRDEPLTLAWTGEVWRLEGEDICTPQLMMDLGGWMLLKVTAMPAAPAGGQGALPARAAAPDGTPEGVAPGGRKGAWPMPWRRPGRWLATSRALSPDAWHRFRAAVYSAPFKATPGLSSEQLPL